MPGLTTPKGGNTKTTTTSTQASPYIQDANATLVQLGQSVLNPYISTPAYTTAPINSDQSGAYDLTRYLATNSFAPSTQVPFWALPSNSNQPFSAQASTYQPTSYSASTYDATGYTPSTYAAATYAPSTYTPSTYAPTTIGNAGTYNTALAGPASTYAAANANAAQTTGEAIQALINPYLQSTLDPTLRNMRRERDISSADIGAKAAASGSFGGSREAIQRGQLDRSYGEQVATTAANLMSQGWDRGAAIAQANTQNQQSANLSNAAAQNAASQFGASAQNAVNLANASALNQAGQFNTSAQNAVRQIDAAAQNTAGQYNTGAQNTAGQYNAGAQNTAGQYNTGAQNTAGQFNSGVQNTAGQFMAGAQNTAGQYNAGTNTAAAAANAAATNAAGQYNAGAQNARDQFGATLGLQQQQQGFNQEVALAQLQEAIRTGDQTRQLQAINALLGIGNAQQQYYQNNLNVPLQYLQALGALTPKDTSNTQTSTAPNTANSPLMNILGLGTSFLGMGTGGGNTVFGNLIK